MSKFKVGDTVRRIEDGSNGNAVTKGNLYEVKEVSGSSIIVIDDTGKLDRFCIKKFELVSKELTSLSEKWCIKRNKENYLIINNWFISNGYGTPSANCDYIHINGHNYDSPVFVPTGYTEITFDQFKKWVLGNPRKEDLLAEAKKRFPLGTTFYPVSASTATVSKEVGTGTVKSELDIKWLGEEIINIGSNGYLYSRGTWAEIVSCNTVAPTPDKEHKTESLLEEAKRRYPVGTKFKSAKYSNEVREVVNDNWVEYGSNIQVGSNFIMYDHKWAEIISRPEERSSIYWECIQPSYYNPPAFKLGTVYKQKGELTGSDTINFEEDSLGSKTNGWSKEFFKPSTREAYDAQFKKQEDFKVGDWVVVLPEDSYFKNSEKCAQRIRSIDPSPKNTLPYQLEFKNGSTNTYKKIRKATPEEIADVNGGYKAGIYKEPASTHSSGLLSPDVGPIWNKGLRDYPSCYSGAGVAMLGGIGGALSGGKPFWQDLPDFEVRTEELNPMEVYKRYGVYIHKSPPEMKPSSKVSVNTHEEFKITINKPKTIKI